MPPRLLFLPRFLFLLPPVGFLEGEEAPGGRRRRAGGGGGRSAAHSEPLPLLLLLGRLGRRLPLLAGVAASFAQPAAAGAPRALRHRHHHLPCAIIIGTGPRRASISLLLLLLPGYCTTVRHHLVRPGGVRAWLASTHVPGTTCKVIHDADPECGRYITRLLKIAA